MTVERICVSWPSWASFLSFVRAAIWRFRRSLVTACPKLRYLREQTGKVIDLSVRLGSIPALWLPARLLALPVSPEIAEQRRAHLLEKARNQGHVPSAEALALASWNLIVTNLAASQLEAQEVLLLYRARW